MTAPRLVVKFEQGIDGPCTLLRNGRPVANGNFLDSVHRRMRPEGLEVGGEYTVVTPTADIHMKLLSREERAAGAKPVLDVKRKHAQPQNGGATA